jgi:hypothetical protein
MKPLMWFLSIQAAINGKLAWLVNAMAGLRRGGFDNRAVKNKQYFLGNLHSVFF